MKKILAVFTGGTIGSKLNNGIIDAANGTGYALIDAFYKSAKTDAEFETLQPLNILSENLTPAHWETLYNALLDKDLSAYCGIIITHGSDTLPFTAAAFSYLLKNLYKPVVFVASNYPLGHPRSNGAENFTAAAAFILSKNYPGVFSAYKRADGKMIIYLGTRILEADCATGEFSSYQGMDFGELRDGQFIPIKAAEFLMSDYAGGFRPAQKLPRLEFGKKILAIRPYPGLDYRMFGFSPAAPAAVLHGLYHSSTACAAGNEYSLVSFTERCKENNIAVWLYSCRQFSGDLYASTDLLKNSGAKILAGISFEAAYAKLAVAYNQTQKPPEDYLKENIFFEFV